jgi:hypothetical protein
MIWSSVQTSTKRPWQALPAAVVGAIADTAGHMGTGLAVLGTDTAAITTIITIRGTIGNASSNSMKPRKKGKL